MIDMTQDNDTRGDTAMADLTQDDDVPMTGPADIVEDMDMVNNHIMNLYVITQPLSATDI